jgi:hypothetical protein
MDPETYKRLNSLEYQFGILDRKVTLLLNHLGIQYTDARPPPDEIETLILAGDRIKAMKLYEAKHGVNLLEAKRAIEQMAARLGLS